MNTMTTRRTPDDLFAALRTAEAERDQAVEAFAARTADAEKLDKTITDLLAMLDQRERTAQAAYDEIRDRVHADERTARGGGVPAMSEEEMRAERVELRRASSRWTEAQEALAEARKLAGRPAP